MAFFDSIIDAAAEKFDLGDRAETLLSALLSMITDQKSGGFDGFLDLFKKSNLGDLITSWISSEDNAVISDEQVKSALGGETIENIASKVGVSEDKAVSALSYILPQVVDKLTPDGKVPDGESLLSKVGDFVSGLGGRITSVAETGVNDMVDKLGDATKTIDKGKEIVGDVTGAVEDTVETAGDVTKAVVSKSKEAFGDVAEAVGNELNGEDNSMLQWLLPLLILVLLLILSFWYFNRGKSNPSANTNSVNKSINVKNKRNNFGKRELSSQDDKWLYDETKDSLSKGTIKRAILKSSNQLDFGFPYQGYQRATLTLRKHPRYGENAILSVERGQFICDVSGCKVLVRFDTGKAVAYHADEPQDYSFNAIFIRNYSSFVSRVKKAKKTYVEATFHNEGNRVMEFNVKGLNF